MYWGHLLVKQHCYLPVKAGVIAVEGIHVQTADGEQAGLDLDSPDVGETSSQPSGYPGDWETCRARVVGYILRHPRADERVTGNEGNGARRRLHHLALGVLELDEAAVSHHPVCGHDYAGGLLVADADCGHAQGHAVLRGCS